MSASPTRRRLSLLSSGSLLAALVVAGAGGLTLTPGIALAANECVTGNVSTLATPDDNGATSDTYVCAGSYSSVTYTTNGTFTLRLQNKATATTGGLRIIGATGTSITVNRLADSPAASGDPSLTSTSGPGLWVTNGPGNININLGDNNDAGDTPMTISGTTAGVLLQNSGAGNTSYSDTNGTITASAGSAIDATTTGTGAINVSTGAVVTASAWGVRAGATSGNVDVTNSGQLDGGAGAILVIGGVNARLTNTAVGTINGIVTLNNTGSTNFTNSGNWAFSGTSSLGVGDSTLTGAASSQIAAGLATTLDFAAGADTFANAGALVGGAGIEGASTLTLLGLETWNNSGSLIFGGGANGDSDGVADDRIVSAGTLFTGSGDSLLVMDVDMTANQAGCPAAVTADCLDLRGSSTAGVTGVRVNIVGASLTGADRIVLVDVAGAGTSGAGHFIVDESSRGYRLVGATDAVESGIFFYAVDYDAAAKQHFLAPAAFSGKALEVARIGRAAAEPWRTATGLWQERQLDLRDSLADGPGAWVKVASNVVTQKGLGLLDLGSDQAGYNMGSRQDTTAIVGGLDLMRMHDGDGAWVLGLTAGRLDSTLGYRVGTSKLEMEGYSVGAYATWVSGRLFVDAIVNGASVDISHSDLGQTFEGAATSLGYQLEGGYRLFEMNDGGAYVEPIAAVSYVRTKVDDFDIGPVAASFNDGSSLRAAVGLRVAGDLEAEAFTARLGFTGRVWKEVDGEHATTLRASFGQSRFIDSDVDTLGDVGVSLGLFRPGGRLSANIAYSLKFAENYQSSDASIGLRLRW